jgi:hypothetical protein
MVAHTLKSYSSYTFDYPYPKAISINARDQGMEYPMICWNFGRPDAEGKYTDGVKYGMLGVICHEVGHNFFPMIINSDERQWTWMDEGLNSFMEFLAEKSFDPKFPLRRGPAKNIVPYMSGDQKGLEPIMTNSESIRQFGNNAYGKPATALNILRETIMGPELFDYAFKTYANRWKFKHPTPEDFFRTMEDASAVDLDWFWRGWFYETDPVDIAINDVRYFRMNTRNPEVELAYDKQKADHEGYVISRKRNKDAGLTFAVEADTTLLDFYNKWDRYAITPSSKAAYDKFYNTLSTADKAVYDKKRNFYEIDFENKGGLVMPLIVEWTFTDGTKEVDKIPAYIWRKDEQKVTKVFAKDKEVASIRLDPNRETADIDEVNNSWPRRFAPSRFDLYKQQQSIRGASSGTNPMQEAQKK